MKEKIFIFFIFTFFVILLHCEILLAQNNIDNKIVIQTLQRGVPSAIIDWYENELLTDSTGGYSFSGKSQVHFTGLAVAWLATSDTINPGDFELEISTKAENDRWTVTKTKGATRPSETPSGFYWSYLYLTENGNRHNEYKVKIFTKKGVALTFVRLSFSDVSEGMKISGYLKERTLQKENEIDVAPQPTIITRSEWWGSLPSNQINSPSWPPVAINISHAVIHHTVDANNPVNPAQVVRQIWDYHTNNLGWGDIGYNFLIDQYGNIYQGRNNPWLNATDTRAAHAGGGNGEANNVSVGIALIGQFQSTVSDPPAGIPDSRAIRSLENLIAWRFEQRSLDPLGTANIITYWGIRNLGRITGHREIGVLSGATDCPGDNFYIELPSIRNNVKSLLTSTGYASVSQGVSINPVSVIYGNNFTTSFTLKEIQGSSITFESVVCAILKSDNTHLRDMEVKGPITVQANGTYNYTSTQQWRLTDPPGTYKAMARGKVSGGNWFDFTTIGSGTNNVSFNVPQVALSINPSIELNFGDVEIGQSKTMSVTITNTTLSTANLTVAPSIPTTPFQILNGASLSLPPGDSYSFDFKFTPTYAQTYNQSWTFTHNATNFSSPWSISLEGTGTTSSGPPAVQTLTATGISCSTATFKGNINPNNLLTTAWFEYSQGSGLVNPSTTSPVDIAVGQDIISVNQSVGGLPPSVQYYYRVVANNSAGTSRGEIMNFETTACGTPIVQTTAASGVTSSSVQLNGIISSNGGNTWYHFEWGKTTNYELSDTTFWGPNYYATPTQVNLTLGGLTFATAYHYRLVAKNNLGISYGDDMTFTTLSVTDLIPIAAIVSPTNDQTFTTPNITVQGTASDQSPGYVSIVDIKLNSGNWETAEGTTTWSKQLTLQEGSNTITARAKDNAGQYSTEDSVIVIYSNETKRIALKSPNGGEHWQAGSEQYIIWEKKDINNIIIQYSTNDGIAWNNIIASSENNGTYKWKVPKYLSSLCRVRVINSNNSTESDISDSSFTIYQSPITIISPNSGDVSTKSSFYITWATESVLPLNIYLTTDNGLTWEPIIYSVNPSDSQYYWTVPDYISDSCKIKISVDTEPIVYDVSDNTFTIGATTLIDNEFSNIIPGEFYLYQNYPNPFNPTTNIKFLLPQVEHVTLKIYDMLGLEVATLVDKPLSAGWYTLEWKAENVASGIYVYKISAGKFTDSKKLVVMK